MDRSTGQTFTPVFVLGPARAGTSLLYKVLCLHPRVFYVNNWVARFPTLTWLSALDRAVPALPSMRDKVWFGSGGDNAYVYGSRRPLADRLFPMPVEGEAFFRASGIVEDGSTFIATGGAISMMRRRIGQLHRFAGGTHFVNKRIANNRRVELLLEAFPHARFITIVRDGRAVAYSLSRVDWWRSSNVWWYGASPAQWEAEGREPWVMCARNWLEDMRSVESGLDLVPNTAKLTIRYEDLITAPGSTFRAVAEFSGLVADQPWLQRIARLEFPDRNESWRTQLDHEVVATITREQEPLLRQYGYST